MLDHGMPVSSVEIDVLERAVGRRFRFSQSPQSALARTTWTLPVGEGPSADNAQNALVAATRYAARR